MRAELAFFGKRIDMSARIRRRALVVLMYLAFAVLVAILWHSTHWRAAGAWVVWAVIPACRLFLGGYYSGGLVKRFDGKAPQQLWLPPSLLALRLNFYRPVLAADKEAYSNDERELTQRDRAHYIAYQILAAALLVPMFVASLRTTSGKDLLDRLAIPPTEFYYGLTMIGVVLFFTLPQAILLWTEPDMEPIIEAK